MMRRIGKRSIAGALFLAGACASCSNDSNGYRAVFDAASVQSRIIWSGGTDRDLGAIPKTDRNVKFEVLNAGGRSVSVDRVDVSCGCVGVGWASEGEVIWRRSGVPVDWMLPPGGKHSIVLRVTPKGFGAGSEYAQLRMADHTFDLSVNWECQPVVQWGSAQALVRWRHGVGVFMCSAKCDADAVLRRLDAIHCVSEGVSLVRWGVHSVDGAGQVTFWGLLRDEYGIGEGRLMLRERSYGDLSDAIVIRALRGDD